MRAHGKEAEPEAAAACLGETSRIARQIAINRQHRPDRLPLQRSAAQAMIPALCKPERLLVLRDRQTIGIGEIAQQNRWSVEPRPATDQPSQIVLLHEISAPILR